MLCVILHGSILLYLVYVGKESIRTILAIEVLYLLAFPRFLN